MTNLTKWMGPRWLGDMFPSFDVDNFFGKDGDSLFDAMTKGTMVPAVNISDLANAYKLEVAVPGFKKEDFKVEIDNGMLMISGEHKEEKAEKEEKYTRKEFSYSTFSRSFTLPDNIDDGKIKATYNDGILFVELAKVKAEAPKNPKKIAVS